MRPRLPAPDGGSDAVVVTRSAAARYREWRCAGKPGRRHSDPCPNRGPPDAHRSCRATARGAGRRRARPPCDGRRGASVTLAVVIFATALLVIATERVDRTKVALVGAMLVVL